MSTTFKLSGTGFDRKSWEQQLQKLLRGEAGWVPLQCMERLYTEAAIEPLKKGAILLLGKGSSRGVSVESRENHVSLELMSLASEVDWDVARWLLVAGHKLGAEVRDEEGQNLNAEELKCEAFQARSQKVLRAELGMTRAIMAKDGGDKVLFPVAHFEIRLSTAELGALELDALMDSLVKQCYRYGNAYLARRMEWQGPDGTRSIGAHYSTISTLVPADVQGMTFSGPDGYYTDKLVPMEKVKEVLAEFITQVGNYLYLPPIPWGDRPALLEALTGKSTKEILHSLDLQLGESLTRLPVLAFVLTAHADGEVDQKEMQAFMNYVSHAAANEDDQSIFANTCRRLQQEMKQAIAGIKGLNHAVEFQLAVGQVDHRLNQETRERFKRRVYELAETVATASGGGFLGMGAKISDAEKQALAWIHKTLFPPEKP
ncbi:MAG TPA: hypothetical protein VEC99_07455 [Clostridia bacterium]|nr:hypothetical protein [Clostridia bacterium]